MSIVSSVWPLLTQGIQLAATAASDSSLSTFLLTPAIAVCLSSLHARLRLRCVSEAIVAELLIFNFNTVIFNISHHAALLPHPSITSTFRLDLSDIFSLGANSHFVAENEMSLLPLESVTLWAAGSAHVFSLIFYSNVTVFFFLVSE